MSSLSKPKFSFKRKVVTPSTILPTIAKEPLKSIGTTDQPSSTHLILSSRSQSFLTRSSLPEHSSQTNLSIFDLDHCIVDLLGKDSEVASKDDLSISALHVRNLSNCVLLLPIIEGSALLHDMSNCTIVLGCHQVCQVVTYSQHDRLKLFGCSLECIRPKILMFFYQYHPIQS